MAKVFFFFLKMLEKAYIRIKFQIYNTVSLLNVLIPADNPSIVK